MSISKAFLNSMSKIPCLETRMHTWNALIEEQHSINDDHPAFKAYDANLLLKHIKFENLQSIPFVGKDFNVPLFLTLFKSEYKKQNITPESAIKHIHALSLIEVLKDSDANLLKTSLEQLKSESHQTINAHSLFAKPSSVENSDIRSMPNKP